jgi:hypothetical protein
MEISRPNPAFKDDSPLRLYERDRMAEDAVNNFLRPQDMFRMFLGTVKGQPSDSHLQKTIKKRFRVLENGNWAYVDSEGKRCAPPSIYDLGLLQWRYECTTDSDYRITGTAIKELPSEAIGAIENVLRKRNRILFRDMWEVIRDLLPIKEKLK